MFPIGVDVDAVQHEARHSQSSDTVRRMSCGLLGRRCVIGVDRLDYSKGLVARFEAYERFMEAHPESLNRVTFLQISPLSRADVRAYAEIRRSLEQALLPVIGHLHGKQHDRPAAFCGESEAEHQRLVLALARADAAGLLRCVRPPAAG